MFKAYCFVEGDIGFGYEIPEGAVILAEGPEADLRRVLETECPIGMFSGKTARFIPAVNAANGLEDQTAAGDALGKWLDEMAEKHSEEPVTFWTMKS